MKRTLTIFNLGVLAILIMTVPSNASIQERLENAQSILIARASLPLAAVVPTQETERMRSPATWWNDVDLPVDADFRWSRSDALCPVSACDLAKGTPLKRLSDPEPSTLAIWSLIGLCWAGASVWRRKRSRTFQGRGAGPRRTRRCGARPPWPEHVRAAIQEIIERGCPR
jgi:hypothetical protein